MAAGLAGVMLLAGVAAAGAPAEKLAIVAATWRAEKAELKVEGVSRYVDGVVLVRDAATKRLLGSAAVRRDGKWMLKVRDPFVVPAKMRVEVEGACSECVVEAWNDPATAIAAQTEAKPAQ